MARFFYAVDFGKLNQRFLGHIELVEMGTSTSLSVHLLSVHLDKENARLKNYHIFK
jgi:hypothetical protein